MFLIHVARCLQDLLETFLIFQFSGSWVAFEQASPWRAGAPLAHLGLQFLEEDAFGLANLSGRKGKEKGFDCFQ